MEVGALVLLVQSKNTVFLEYHPRSDRLEKKLSIHSVYFVVVIC
jgi:hypothetical protein